MSVMLLEFFFEDFVFEVVVFGEFEVEEKVVWVVVGEFEVFDRYVGEGS